MQYCNMGSRIMSLIFSLNKSFCRNEMIESIVFSSMLFDFITTGPRGLNELV